MAGAPDLWEGRFPNGARPRPFGEQRPRAMLWRFDMKTKAMTRRNFVKVSLVGGGGAALLAPVSGLLAKATASREGICVTLCNHWSYTGIGWQLGIES